nr:hypothetical protein [Rufibacter sp. XAAS-G3-1]
MPALYHLALAQQPVGDEPAVEGVAEDLGQGLVIQREPLCLQPLDDVGVTQALLGLELEGQPYQLSGLVGFDDLLSVHAVLVVAHGRRAHPEALAHLGLHARHALLTPLVVVELGEEELDALLELAARRHGVHRLGDGHHGDAQLRELVGDVDGVGPGAREAVVAVDDDVAYLVAALPHEVQHQLEVLALVVLGALVGAPEGGGDLVAVALGVTAAALQLGLQALVRLGLLFRRYTRVDDGHLAPGHGFVFLLVLHLRTGEDAQVNIARHCFAIAARCGRHWFTVADHWFCIASHCGGHCCPLVFRRIAIAVHCFCIATH